MQRGRRYEATGTVIACVGIVAVVADADWGGFAILSGLVVFLIGRFL